MAVKRTPGFNGATLIGVSERVLSMAELRISHDAVHLIIHDVPSMTEVHRIDRLVVTITLITIQILGLATVPGIMEEQRIVRLSILHEPMHGSQDVLLGGLTLGVLLVVHQSHHVARVVAESLLQEPRHVLDIVDAAAQLSPLTDVIDADKQRLALPRAVTVRKRIVETRNAEAVLAGRRRVGSAGNVVLVGILVGRHYGAVESEPMT